MLGLALPIAGAAALLVAAAAFALWLDRRRGGAREIANPSVPPPEAVDEAEPARTTLVFSPGRSGALERTAFEKTIDFAPSPEVLEGPAKPT